MVKKKIPTKRRTFDDVLEEVEMFFRARRKMLAPGVLRDVLVRIGLPQAKVIVSDKEPATPTLVEEPKAEISEEPEPMEVAEPETPTPPLKDEAATFIENPDLEPGVTQLDGEEFQDISDALSVVESMSDSFMAAAPKNSEVSEPEKPKLKIEISGVEEITAAPTTYASAPTSREEEPTPIEDGKFIPDEAYEGQSVEPEDVVPDEVLPELEPEVEDEPEPVSVEPVKVPTPDHVVKPLVHSKVLILGEDGVGKQSLMNKAEMEAVPSSEDVADFVPYIHSKVFETEDYRVRLNVWSFDEAVRSKITRKEFYEEAEALIIVYAASDRWSFDSIDFWLKEATITTEDLPPIVITANKTDLITDVGEDTGDKPVTKEEGFALAEELAQRVGSEETLHPVAFIGTSCLTGEGVVDVFRTAAQLAAWNK
ncbi:MAG: ADP-ribosylation factor-like protein [Candidatus Thorarchaeota archaeon]